MNRSEPQYFQNDLTRSSRVIYTPSAFAHANLLYLQEVGTLSALMPHTSSRENLSSYLFFVVTEGKGTLTYGGQRFELAKGSCAFIDCRKGYQQETSHHVSDAGEYDELWSLSWLHFNGPTMNEIYNKYKERGGRPVFASKYAEQYPALVQTILDVAASESYVRDMQIAEKLTALLSFLMEDAWSPETASAHAAPKRQSIKKIKEYIDTHYAEKLTLDSLASAFFINKEYLAHIFKEEYGFTVNGYIAQVRISNAKSLLRFSDKTIEQVGAEVGLPDANYFSRTFKKIEGVSPTQYKTSW